MSAHGTNDRQGVNFDRDLARLDQIRRAHKSARPTHENPAWLNTHGDLGFALGFIDSLWSAYTTEGRKADAVFKALQRAILELEQYVDLQQKLDYIEYAADTQKEIDEIKAAAGIPLTALDKTP
jgi:hypothetical protein